MKRLHKLLLTASVVGFASLPSLSYAQANLPIACPGYEKPKTQLLGERAGKKMQKAYEVFLNEELGEKERTEQTIQMLREIEAKEPFDRASIDRFLGQILAQQEDEQEESLKLLKSAADASVLNDKEQADLLMLIGNLSLQEEDYPNAVAYYQKWMDYTCKEDADTYTRIAKAYVEMKEYNKVLTAADKAISLYPEPNKNPYALKIAAHVELKNFTGAVDVAETLVELFPSEGNWWTTLASFYMMTEDYKKALATFALAYKQGYLTRKSHYKTLVNLYAANDVPYKSAQIQIKYMENGTLDTNADEYASLANTLQLAREYKDAAKYYGMAANTGSDPDHFRKQGVLLLTAEDYKGAIDALNKALENGIDEEGKVHFSLMEAHFYAGNFRQAKVHAEEAKKDPSLRRNANAWLPYIKQKADNRGIRI